MVLLLGMRVFAQDWTLCAKVNPLRLSQGESVQLGRHASPVLWGFNRDVHFQVCALDGRPIQRPVKLALEIEPLDGQFEVVRLAPSEAASDSRGRFTATYGAGGLQPGEAWPEGTISRERHRFLSEGRVIATFVVERSARNVTFSQERDTPVASQRPAKVPKAGLLADQAHRP